MTDLEIIGQLQQALKDLNAEYPAPLPAKVVQARNRIEESIMWLKLHMKNSFSV